MENFDPKIIPISGNGKYHSNFKNTGPFEQSTPAVYNKGGNSDGGGGNMEDKYATKEYVDHKVDDVLNKIDLLEAHLDTKFESVNTKFESVNTKFESINTKFANQRTWIIVTLIAVVGSGTGLFQLLIKAIQNIKF